MITLKTSTKVKFFLLFLFFVCFKTFCAPSSSVNPSTQNSASQGKQALASANSGSEIFSLSASLPQIYKKRTLYNLRIRENNKYKGFVYREVREKYSAMAGNGSSYSGAAYIFEEMKRDGADIVKKLDTVIEGTFFINRDGEIEREEGSVFPLIAGFPAAPVESGSTKNAALKVGETWVSNGTIFVDPRKKGVFTKVKFICQYKYEGKKPYKGADTYLVTAQYAMRYKKGEDPNGDELLENISGSHKVAIYFSDALAAPFFIQDDIDETYTYPDVVISSQGFSHTWYSDVIPMKKSDLKTDIADSIADNGLNKDDFNITEKTDGVSFATDKILFAANKADLLPGEEKKIEAIANILKRIKNRTFMVTGHTAAIGSVESQVELSFARAEKIAQLIKGFGIPADRVIFTGKGGSEPVAPNDTEENMSKNRRVEIVILED